MRAGDLRTRVSIRAQLPMPTPNASGDLYISDSTYQYDGIWSSVSLPTLVAAINAYSGSEEFTVYVGNEPPLSGDALSLDLTAETLDSVVSYTHPGGKYVEGPTGNLVASAENEWALEYRDGVAVGRSVWGERTNVLFPSEDFSTSWTVNGTSITATEDTGLGLTVWELLTSVSSSGIFQSRTLQAGKNTAFVIAKADTATGIFVRYGSPINRQARFDLLAGTVVSTDTGVTGHIYHFGDGWYLCAATYDVPSSGSQSVAIYAVNPGTVKIIAAQAGDSSFPGPYIKTEGTPVTRPAESPSFTLGSEYNSAGFTFRVAGESAAGIDGRQVYLSLNDGTTDNAVRVYRDTDRTLYVEVTKAGVQQCLLDMGVLADSTAFELGARIAPDDMAASLGATEVTGTGEVPTLTTGNIGHELGADQCNSILSEISIEPKQSLWHDGTDLFYGNTLLWTDTGNAEYASAVAEWGDGTHTAFYEADATDDLGSPITELVNIATVWAAVEPLSGKEYWSAKQTASEVSARIRIRYRANVASVDASMKVIHGADEYDIDAPLKKVGPQRDEIHLMCTRR